MKPAVRAERISVYQKTFLLILHLLALLLFLSGICLLYGSSEFREGLNWVNPEHYEDSPGFEALLRDRFQQLLGYVRYRDVFETDGKFDTDNEVFAYSDGDGAEKLFSVADVLTYSKEHGYSFDSDYRVIHDDAAPGGDGQTYPITWRAYRETQRATGPGSAFKTLDTMTREVMQCLGDYYRGVKLFNTGNSNLYYFLHIEGRKDYTNRPGLSDAQARSFGRYAIFNSENPLPDNNLPETPNKIRSLLLDEVSSRTAEYHLILAVDTNYPLKDAFYQGVLNYAHQRAFYGLGLALLLFGAGLMLLSLVPLSVLSGHRGKGSREIFLFRFDRHSFEGNFLLLTFLCILCDFLAVQIIARLLRLILPSSYWEFSEKLLSAAIIYLFVLIFYFSALRAYKAGLLWKNSFLRELVDNLRSRARDVSFAQRITVYYLIFLLANLTGAVGCAFLLLHEKSLNARLEALSLALLLSILDLWLYQHLYQKQTELDEIVSAIGTLDAEPDRSEQLLDPARFHGREAKLAATINNISSGLQRALNDSIRSERMKAELITNVSHDIKTPLTSIINYIDLIRRAHPSDPAVQNYVDILEKKSQHLKTLTEDLVEASKASTGNVQIDPVKINFVELVEQSNGEFEERFEERSLTLVPTLPAEPLYIFADGQHLWRVLENLYNNACKYAAANSRVYADVSAEEGFVSFTLKNISANALNISPEELTERFVRGDRSRTTEGSGLGLSIAKSLTELQGGTLDIQIDGDYFKACVRFREVSD